MLIVGTLVAVGHNHLRYLVQATSPKALRTRGVDETLTITTTGAASPDLRTDSVAGPLKAISRAVDTGLGRLAAGAKTQEHARALWLSDPSALVGARPIPTAIVRAALRSGSGTFCVDADVDVAGNPVLQVRLMQPDATTVEIYLDVYVAGRIG